MEGGTGSHALTFTVWISLWRAQMIFPLLSIDATGSSRPILNITVTCRTARASARLRTEGGRHEINSADQLLLSLRSWKSMSYVLFVFMRNKIQHPE